MELGLWRSQEERARFRLLVHVQGKVRDFEVDLQTSGGIKTALLSGDMIQVSGNIRAS